MDEIIIEKLSKIYNQGQMNEVKALDDISFKIEKGEFVVVLGASGAGKSTLLNILGGMDNATQGKYYINGDDASNYNEKELVMFRRKHIGFVFQFYNLMPNLTALENIELAASVSDEPLDPKEVLASVSLENRAENFPCQLSGGEQQRIAIARALVKNPTLLLCDEPTGALDSKTGGQILALLYDVSKKYNKTVIVVTHNAKIADCASRIIRINDGHIIDNAVNDTPVKPEDIKW